MEELISIIRDTFIYDRYNNVVRSNSINYDSSLSSNELVSIDKIDDYVRVRMVSDIDHIKGTRRKMDGIYSGKAKLIIKAKNNDNDLILSSRCIASFDTFTNASGNISEIEELICDESFTEIVHSKGHVLDSVKLGR